MNDDADREQLINEIADDFRCTFREIHRGMPHEWLDTEITMPQFKTLMVLFGMGQATMGELADALGTGVSTVTGIVDRLVDHGLVVREEDRHDRRVVVGRPTAKGLELVDRLMVATRELTTRALSRLTTDELNHVAKAARLLRRAATNDLVTTATSVP
jgi:DNA-binding MarR family transcriptional regulator